METKLPHLKVGQIWRRNLTSLGRKYTAYYMLKTKNSNNMWYIEMIWYTPANVNLLENDSFNKQFMHKDRIIESLELVGDEANIKTLKVLFG